MKPQYISKPDYVNVKAKRKCMKCGRVFNSKGAGFRHCTQCKMTLYSNHREPVRVLSYR